MKKVTVSAWGGTSNLSSYCLVNLSFLFGTSGPADMRIGIARKVYRAPLRYPARRTMDSSVPWAYNMKPSFFGRGTKVTTIGTWDDTKNDGTWMTDDLGKLFFCGDKPDFVYKISQPQP